MKEPEAAVAAPPAPLAWKAAIDFKSVKENAEAVQANADKRAAPCDVARVVDAYDRYQALNREADEIRERRNANAKGMKGKMEPEKRAALIQEGKDLKDQLAALDADLLALETELDRGAEDPERHPPRRSDRRREMAALRRGWEPSATFPSRRRRTSTSARSSGCSISRPGARCGSRFVCLTGAARCWARAHQLGDGEGGVEGVHADGGSRRVRQSTMEKCGFQPRAENTQVYNVEDSDLCLAGTAEILLGGVYMDETLAQAQLPIKMAAFSHCFRTEAGAAGAATRGLYRLHQFSKVEMFVIATPEQSEAIHDELIAIEEEMYEELGFHFKVLDMSSEDLGAPAFRKFDIEAWMPALERYGEISSASNCTDYQARRLNIRYRPDAVEGKKQPLRHAHTLNATACAVPRMIITILENFQNEDGSVDVPEALRPFMGGVEKLTPEVVEQNAE